MAPEYRITSPLADLRQNPGHLEPDDRQRNSQLIYNERVKIIDSQGEWHRIQALEQPFYDPKRGWIPYEGWIHTSEIASQKLTPKYVCCHVGARYPYGTFLAAPAADTRPLAPFNREQLVREAPRFLGRPYLWGGRGDRVDCSSLIQLLYRAQNITIPRDAADQYRFGRPSTHLTPGDPLYLAKEERISHVILYLGDGVYIEAPETGKDVRLLSEGREIWQEEGKVFFFDRPAPYTPHPCSFLFQITA